MQRPRVVSLARIEHNDNLLFIVELFKNKTTYRFLGGTIEHCESSKAALEREIQEELKANVSVGELSHIVEKTYAKNNKINHVIYLIYECRLKKLPENPFVSYLIEEDTKWSTASWIPINQVNSSGAILPEEIAKHSLTRQDHIRHVIAI